MFKNVDKHSPEYKKEVTKVVALILGLGLIGGSFLGWRISQAESAAIAQVQAIQDAKAEAAEAEQAKPDTPSEKPAR